MPVPQAGPVDPERAESGEALVRAVGVPISGQRAPRELGSGRPGLRDVGAGPRLILPQRCVRPAVSSTDDGTSRSRAAAPSAIAARRTLHRAAFARLPPAPGR